MFKSIASALAVTAALAAATVSAYADDDMSVPVCRTYANRAMHQAEVARSVSSCRHYVAETPQRWHLNYDRHFNWCISNYGSGRTDSEDAIRSRQTRECS